MFSTMSFVISLLTWLADMPILHPQLPVLSPISLLFAFVPVMLGPTRKNRYLGGALIVFLICSTIFRFNLYTHSEERMRTVNTYTEPLKRLQAKMAKYCLEHPSISLTNLSDYVQVGALVPTDTNFLHNSALSVFPYTATRGNPFFEMIHDGMKATMFQDGMLTWHWIGKKITDTNVGTPRIILDKSRNQLK
jgi:hypothetical protein